MTFDTSTLPRLRCHRQGWHLPHSYFSPARGWLFCQPVREPAPEPEPLRSFADTCCGRCTGPCYVDQVTGA